MIESFQTIKQLVKDFKAQESAYISRAETEKNCFDLLCQTLDRQIDDAVYKLYGLTEEERECLRAIK